jgi:hypothetical protein
MDISIKINNIWNELEKIGLAVGCISNVSTRGGELREHETILPPEVVDFLRSYPYPELRTELERYKIFRVLDDYSKAQIMPKDKFLKLISDLKIDISEVKKLINELYELGITTRYLEAESTPYLIRNMDEYRKFLHERYLVPIKDSIIKEVPKPLPEELEMKPETPFRNLNQVYDMIKNLQGTVLVLDKDFGFEGLNFFRNLDPAKVKELKILLSKSHMSQKFRIEYKAFRDEMENISIEVDLRVLNDADAQSIHDRYLIDDSKAYNTPPWNIINTKLGDIKKIENRESKIGHFRRYWSRASEM